MGFFASLINSMPSAVAQGLIWGIMAIGVYLTYRILDVADLTVDGSLGTGGAVCVVMVLNGAPVGLAYTTVGTNTHITYSNGQTDKDVVTTEGMDMDSVSEPEISGDRASWLDKLL